MNEARIDLARTTLGVLFIGGLTVASFWILRPFFAAFIWSITVVVATWPMLMRMESWFGGRRGPAVVVMTLVMLAVFVLPIAFAVGAIAENAGEAVTWVKGLAGSHFPSAPPWLGRLPLVGARAMEAWNEFAGRGYPEIATHVEPYAQDVTRWVLAEASTIGLMIVQCLLIVILSAVLYAGGEAWAGWVLGFGRRLGNERGENAVVLAGQAIRGVALGVVVTAILQATLGGIGIAIAGVPFAVLLTALMFVLCIAQVGPLLILLAGAAWLFLQGDTAWAIFMLVWSAVVGLMDNFVRPVLIKRGADLPLLLIFAGVIGGLLSFGLVGIFVGPVVLAVTYTLVDAWVFDRTAAPT